MALLVLFDTNSCFCDQFLFWAWCFWTFLVLGQFYIWGTICSHSGADWTQAGGRYDWSNVAWVKMTGDPMNKQSLLKCTQFMLHYLCVKSEMISQKECVFKKYLVLFHTWVCDRVHFFTHKSGYGGSHNRDNIYIEKHICVKFWDCI